MNNATKLRKENKTLMDELNEITGQPKTLLQNMIYKYMLENKNKIKVDIVKKEITIE